MLFTIQENDGCSRSSQTHISGDIGTFTSFSWRLLFLFLFLFYSGVGGPCCQAEPQKRDTSFVLTLCMKYLCKLRSLVFALKPSCLIPSGHVLLGKRASAIRLSWSQIKFFWVFVIFSRVSQFILKENNCYRPAHLCNGNPSRARRTSSVLFVLVCLHERKTSDQPIWKQRYGGMIRRRTTVRTQSLNSGSELKPNIQRSIQVKRGHSCRKMHRDAEKLCIVICVFVLVGTHLISARRYWILAYHAYCFPAVLKIAKFLMAWPCSVNQQ